MLLDAMVDVLASTKRHVGILRGLPYGCTTLHLLLMRVPSILSSLLFELMGLGSFFFNSDLLLFQI